MRELALMITGLCALASCAAAESLEAAGLAKNAYQPLPLGEIRPAGWLKTQLEIQRGGLSGHLDEFWPDIRDSGWIGGPAEGWERAPYWLDGLVPLAYQLDDAELKAKVVRWMDYILTHQREDGWLGPADSKGYKDYDPWPRFVLLKAMAQYHEASGDARVITAMDRFFRFLDKQLDKEPLFEWGQYRWMDGVWSVHWLYDRTGEEWLLGLARKLHDQGYDWSGHFANFEYTRRVTEKPSLKTHGVNNAMAIKAGPVWYRQSRAEEDRLAASEAMATLDKYHGQVTGMFTCDEHYAGLSPSQGTELCAVVEYMFSLETAMAALGDASLGDRLEKIAFNALPATFKKDMWAHQYDQQVNQVLCKAGEDRPFATNGPEANLFGLEPNYGCCTANMHQGWPKFTSSLWMKTEAGLVALSYAPCEVNTKINDKPVKIRVETSYPFNDNIDIFVEAEGTFALDLRIPLWAASGTVSFNDGPDGFRTTGVFRTEREWTGTTKIHLQLPFWPVLEKRFNGGGSVIYGPLVMALPLGEEWKKFKGEEPHADWEVYPTMPWNYALAASYNKCPWEVCGEGALPGGATAFAPENQSLTMKVWARLLPSWGLQHNAAGVLPDSPVTSQEPPTQLTLVPYGCTNLRVAEFPVLSEESLPEPEKTQP